MKRFDALVVHVDEPDVVERLQAKMRRIVIDAEALVALELVEEALKRDAIKQILARVQFETDVDALILVRVEDRLPAASQLVERGFYETGRKRRPGIEERPGERARKTDMNIKAHVAACFRGERHLLGRPFLPRLRVAAYMFGGERVESLIVHGIDRDELALQVGRDS